VQATCALAGGILATASVPSGASTGAAEAHELRDGDPKRYHGLGCRRAVQHINKDLNDELKARDFRVQHEFDRTMLELDGSPNKERLGANAILAVSLAFARAAALAQGIPLYQYFADLVNKPVQTLPRPTINLFSGGKHAGVQVPIQDVLLIPVSATTIDECLVMATAVYQAAAKLVHRKYGMRLLTADEGGLAPAFSSAKTMLDDAIESIEQAGYQPGRDVALAVDVAASHFFRNNHYYLHIEALHSHKMIELLLQWLDHYPIISIEDGLAEDDWSHWPELRKRVAGRALILGDDLLCTNPERLHRAIKAEAADALLLKVNQIGTLTEAAEACRMARAAGWQVTISARSGETEDNWLADLAVGWAGDQIKVGSVTQSDRLAKYNRLLAIEAETGLPLVSWPGGEHKST